jgi:hypothetical protein
VAWASQAEQLARHAAAEVTTALDAVCSRMRRAVVLEFFDAWPGRSELSVPECNHVAFSRP